MNYIITSIFAFFFVWTSVLLVPFKEVETAFTKGDAAKIIELGTQKMLISIDGKEGVYSKSQATLVLDSFFKANPPKSFSFDFKGKEEVENSFAVGNFISDSQFRVSMKFKKEKNNHYIEALTITKMTR